MAYFVNLMRMDLKTGRSSVFFGEDISFTIVLYNGYGKPKNTGGDHLRARLFNHSLGAYTPGRIEDHANGTYTVTFPSLWIGNAQIEVEVLYTHEIIGTAIRLRKTWDFSDLFAIFVDNNYTEITTCGPDYKTVLRYSKTSKVCHFAYWNTSQQWFCGRPANNMLCRHWTSITRFLENYTKGISQCEDILSRRDRQTKIPSNITLKILPREMGDAFEGANISCLNYDNTKLWFNDKPTGYFYNNKWIIAHCKGIEHLDGECLRNKTILFWGDSTLYQWYIYFKRKLLIGSYSVCNRSTGKHGWLNPESCTFHKFNLTIYFKGHNIPVSSFTKKGLYDMFKIISFEEFIKSYSNTGNEVLLVLNLYVHLQQYDFSHFAANVLEIKRSLERIFKTKTNVKVFFKLPHTYRRLKDKEWKLRQNDYVGFIYTHIMRKTFNGLYDKITVLDQKDATIAERSFDIHPPEIIVRGMVFQFLSYVCKSDSNII